MGRFQYDRYSILMYLGILVGALKGYQINGILGSLVLGGILGYIGMQVGRSRKLVQKVIFVIVLVYLNEFLRNLVLGIFSEINNL